jgi:hypothetical protein
MASPPFFLETVSVSNSKESLMANSGSHKCLLVAIAFVLTLLNVDLSSAEAQTESTRQPPKAREVDFIYHTELTGIDLKAHRVEAWIPLPR